MSLFIVTSRLYTHNVDQFDVVYVASTPEKAREQIDLQSLAFQKSVWECEEDVDFKYETLIEEKDEWVTTIRDEVTGMFIMWEITEAPVDAPIPIKVQEEPELPF